MSRGRDAERPRHIPARGWLDVLWRAWTGIIEDRLGLIAAGVAFYGLLALFPAIASAVAIAGLVTEPGWVVTQFQDLSDFIPDAATEIIIGQAEEVAGSSDDGLGLAALLGLILALYSASRGIASLIQGLNVAYGEKEERGIIHLQVLKLALTVLVLLGLLVAALVSVAVPTVLNLVPFPAGTEVLIKLTSWTALLALGALGLAFIYRVGPSRRAARWRWLTPGATLAILLWVTGSAAFGFYVSNFGSYNETFGALAGVVILLMWLWLSAYIVLIGAKIDAEAEAQTRVDSTTGPDRPMGERGAVKADNLGPLRGETGG